MKIHRWVIVMTLILAVASACDLGLNDEDEAPFRDEGGSGADVARADDTASPDPSLTASASPTPTPSAAPTVSPTPDAGVSPSPGPDVDGEDGRPRKRPKPRFAFPRAGSYLYAQQGYEEFCGRTCASDPLPARYSSSVAHGRSSRRAIVIVETARISGNRTTSTVTRHTRSSAHVDRVRVTYTYQGDDYPGRYSPDPEIAALRLPLTTGKRWTGTWLGSTSGSYRIDVGGVDQIQAAGRSVRATRVVVRMEFRGRQRGYSVVTLWIDPSSRVTVASSGSMEIMSDFGRYTSDFDTRLQEGPGY